MTMPTYEENLIRTLNSVDTGMEILRQDVGELKHGMNKLADAVTKLAVIEERQSQVSVAVERMFAGLAAANAEIAALKIAMATATQSGSGVAKWVDRALVGGMALAVGFIMRGQV